MHRDRRLAAPPMAALVLVVARGFRYKQGMADASFESQLKELAFLAELKGQNPFKIKAIQNGARVLKKESDSIADLLQSGRAKNMKGIGKGLLAMMEEYVESGSIAEREELAASFPDTVFELIEIPGLGPKKAKALYNDLGVASLSELEYACNENRLVSLKGFGEKTQSKIIEEISYVNLQRGKVLLPRALHLAGEIRSTLKKEGACIVGQVRRCCEVVDTISLLLPQAPKRKWNAKPLQAYSLVDAAPGVVGSSNFENAEAQLSDIVQVLFSGEFEDGVRLNIFAPAEGCNFGCAEYALNAAPAFLKEIGFFKKIATLKKLKSSTEISKALGIPDLPPELLEVEHAAYLEKLPTDLIEAKDIRGVFHLHTHYSDGANSLEEMIQAAIERKYEYLGVSDHSQTAFYAGGLKEAELKTQKQDMEKLQAKYPQIRLFFGIESDILPNGKLDYPEKILAQFDFVIASVHAQLNQNKEAMTNRICRALENKYTTWLGHATGRLLLGRRGYELDMRKVFATAKRSKKAIELNANPYRLDLDWRYHQEAVKNAISIGIFPDAHSTGGYDDTEYGVMMARKGGLRKQDVTNTKTAEEMQAWLEKNKK